MKLSDLDPTTGFGNESKLEEDRKPPATYPGQSIFVEQPKAVRPPNISVRAIFSPTEGCTNDEWELLDAKTRSNGWTAEEIDEIDRYWRGEFTWRWDIYPALKAHAALKEQQIKAAQQRAETIRREEAISKIGRVHLDCDCGPNGRYVDPSRISYNRVLKAQDSKYFLECSVCGAQFWIDMKIGKRKQ